MYLNNFTKIESSLNRSNILDINMKGSTDLNKLNDEAIKIIQSSKLFHGIKSEDIPSLLPCLNATQQTFRKDNFVYQLGDTTAKVGLVLTGCLHIIKEDYGGNRSILSEVLPGEVFGETYACLKKEAFTVSCVTTLPSTILFLEIHKIITVCSSACNFHTRLIQNLMILLAEKNLLLTQKLDHVTQRSTKEKVLSYLSAQATRNHSNTFTIPFNRQQLADYLSVDRSALSSELSKLKKEGLIDYHKNSFTLEIE